MNLDKSILLERLLTTTSKEFALYNSQDQFLYMCACTVGHLYCNGYDEGGCDLVTVEYSSFTIMHMTCAIMMLLFYI